METQYHSDDSATHSHRLLQLQRVHWTRLTGSQKCDRL